MATVLWESGATAVAQVQSYTFGGTWEASDLVRLLIGNRQVDVTAGSVTTNTVVDNVVTAWNALSSTDYPEFTEITASRVGSALTLTHDTAGQSFTCTITPLESNGGAADDQTIEGAGTATTGTATTAASGPNDPATALNWSGGAIPADNDTVILADNDNDLYGVDQSSIEPTTLKIDSTYTGYIGLPSENANGYPEYRATFWTIGPANFILGQGEGNGSGRLKVNFGADQVAATIYNTGSSVQSELPACQLKGSHASNTLTVYNGDVGFCSAVGDSGTIATATIYGGDVVIGCAVTTLNTYGGRVRLLNGVTVGTWNAYGGSVDVGDSTITTITPKGGKTLTAG
jgi:hypothetical protein